MGYLYTRMGPSPIYQTSPLIVLLSGWARSGKDTAAALLIDEVDFIRVAFADALKEDVAQLVGSHILASCHTASKDKPLVEIVDAAFPDGQTLRDLLIERAAAVRATEPDTYARIVAAAIGTSGRYVITDWRYHNEYDVLRKTLPSAIILRVRIVRSTVIPLSEPSEHDLDGAHVDAVVQNDGSISDLRDKIKAVVHPYLHHS
jgi:hypothetical protein